MYLYLQVSLNHLEDEVRNPDVFCLTDIYHPNIDPAESGCSNDSNICFNMFDIPISAFGFEGIATGLIFLLNHPNLEDPLSPYFEGYEDMFVFEENVKKYMRGEEVEGREFKSGFRFVDGVTTEVKLITDKPPSEEAAVDGNNDNATSETAIENSDTTTEAKETNATVPHATETTVTQANDTVDNVTEIHATEANVTEANDTETNRTENNTNEAIINETNPTEANEDKTYATESNVTEANANEPLKTEGIEDKTNATEANVTEAYATEANEAKPNATTVNVTESNKIEPLAIEANAAKTNETEANITEAKETETNITEAKETETNITEAKETEANITEAKETETNSTQAIVTEANVNTDDVAKSDALNDAENDKTVTENAHTADTITTEASEIVTDIQTELITSAMAISEHANKSPIVESESDTLDKDDPSSESIDELDEEFGVLDVIYIGDESFLVYKESADIVFDVDETPQVWMDDETVIIDTVDKVEDSEQDTATQNIANNDEGGVTCERVQVWLNSNESVDGKTDTAEGHTDPATTPRHNRLRRFHSAFAKFLFLFNCSVRAYRRVQL